MNTKYFNAIDVAVNSPMSASRGILALQGIGLSETGVFGTQAQLASARAPMCTVITDKPSAGGWHPSVVDTADNVVETADDLVAAGAGYEPVGLLAARLRPAHQAIVIRTRQRCRIPR
ncbi:hypothetical protein DFR70_102757 [Nocardia tenerifensis]|uniref:Uncharacterized protein n=1 Tax=Nocardia tenerifensis TaxID=228006 RepID=A0A318KWE1_9NOCA|nr:hypothetical protein [Nocardia tenerifensis]PXX69071.1 hypothetical protein DFR70_102757 [Nocardia tenerifensis]